MRFDAIVADANVLLSASIGKAALKIFVEYRCRVHVTEFNRKEVETYLPRLAAKYDLPEALVIGQWAVLPVEIHPVADYESEFQKASNLLRDRDPEDAHALALAMKLGLPIWSNDHDLDLDGIEFLPTAKLLKILESS